MQIKIVWICRIYKNRKVCSALQKSVQFLTELRDISELTVDAGETHISNLINVLKQLHHAFTDKHGVHFVGVFLGNPGDGLLNHFPDLIIGNRPLLAGAGNAFFQLHRIKRLPLAVLFLNCGVTCLNVLVCGESVPAFIALPPTPCSTALFNRSGVNHPVIAACTSWTFHNNVTYFKATPSSRLTTTRLTNQPPVFSIGSLQWWV